MELSQAAYFFTIWGRVRNCRILMQNADAKEIICRGGWDLFELDAILLGCRGRCSWQACREWVDRDRRRGGDRAALRVLDNSLMFSEKRVATQVFRVSQGRDLAHLLCRIDA